MFMNDLREYYSMIIHSRIPPIYENKREYLLKDMQRHLMLVNKLYKMVKANPSYSPLNNVSIAHNLGVFFHIKINKINSYQNKDYCGHFQNIIDTNCIRTVISYLIPRIYDNPNSLFMKCDDSNYITNYSNDWGTISGIKKFHVSENVILHHFEKMSLCLPLKGARRSLNMLAPSNHRIVSSVLPCIGLFVIVKKEIIDMTRFGEFKMKMLIRLKDYYGIVDVSDVVDLKQSTQIKVKGNKISRSDEERQYGTTIHFVLLKHYKTKSIMNVQSVQKIIDPYLPIVVEYYDNDEKLQQNIQLLPKLVENKPYLRHAQINKLPPVCCGHMKCDIIHLGGNNNGCYGKSIDYVTANEWLIKKQKLLTKNEKNKKGNILNENMLKNNSLIYIISNHLYKTFEKTLIPFNDYIKCVIDKVANKFVKMENPAREGGIEFDLFVEIKHPYLMEHTLVLDDNKYDTDTNNKENESKQSEVCSIPDNDNVALKRNIANNDGSREWSNKTNHNNGKKIRIVIDNVNNTHKTEAPMITTTEATQNQNIEINDGEYNCVDVNNKINGIIVADDMNKNKQKQTSLKRDKKRKIGDVLKTDEMKNNKKIKIDIDTP